MTDRPILRLPKIESKAGRVKSRPDKRPRPRGAGYQGQSTRFQSKFNRLAEALISENADTRLRQDPTGIAPERALVFETIVPISNFYKAAQKVGLELMAEVSLDDEYEIPEELIDEYVSSANPTLYATMPTIETLKDIESLWRGYQDGQKAEKGFSPWWQLFDMLADLRVWGPKDRLSSTAAIEIEELLPEDPNAAVRLELEIWPTLNKAKRGEWQKQIDHLVKSLNGRVIDYSSIQEMGFIYEAKLIDLPAGAVREILDNPDLPESLASLDGIQFILPQTIGQSIPNIAKADPQDYNDFPPFDAETPLRAVLLDSTPIAAHSALNGGIEIADVHELVEKSIVANRKHATSMASLILRGDLKADGIPVADSRLLSVPILIDHEQDTRSPDDRLFVDLIHSTLATLFLGENAIAPDAFVVNVSIGIRNAHFAGKISSLARLIDWWAAQHGLLFIISAGNIPDRLHIPDVTSTQFEDAPLETKQSWIREAQAAKRYERTLMAPAEAINALTVGAASMDLCPPPIALRYDEIRLSAEDEVLPAISSAHGLGMLQAIKPDFLCTSGFQDVRPLPAENGISLSPIANTRSTGLNVATGGGLGKVTLSRGTSCGTALASRAVLNSARALTETEGPYQGQELPRHELALLTKALAVNAAKWPNSAYDFYASLPKEQHHEHKKKEVLRYYGHGLLDPSFMASSPNNGAVLVGTGVVNTHQSEVFLLPLPPSLSGERVGRSMQVTLAWFSPVRTTRASYRLAKLDAMVAEFEVEQESEKDRTWGLALNHYRQMSVGFCTCFSRY